MLSFKYYFFKRPTDQQCWLLRNNFQGPTANQTWFLRNFFPKDHKLIFKDKLYKCKIFMEYIYGLFSQGLSVHQTGSFKDYFVKDYKFGFLSTIYSRTISLPNVVFWRLFIQGQSVNKKWILKVQSFMDYESIEGGF